MKSFLLLLMLGGLPPETMKKTKDSDRPLAAVSRQAAEDRHRVLDLALALEERLKDLSREIVPDSLSDAEQEAVDRLFAALKKPDKLPLQSEKSVDDAVTKKVEKPVKRKAEKPAPAAPAPAPVPMKNSDAVAAAPQLYQQLYGIAPPAANLTIEQVWGLRPADSDKIRTHVRDAGGDVEIYTYVVDELGSVYLLNAYRCNTGDFGRNRLPGSDYARPAPAPR